MTEDQYDAQARELIQRNTRDTLICNKTFFLQELTEALRELGQERDSANALYANTLQKLDNLEVLLEALALAKNEHDSLKSALDLSTQMTEERDATVHRLQMNSVQLINERDSALSCLNETMVSTHDLIKERDSLKSALDLSTQMTEERDMQIDSLKQKLEIARKALAFYADKDNWEDTYHEWDDENCGDVGDRIMQEDVDIEQDGPEGDLILTNAGKHAREALAKLEKK